MCPAVLQALTLSLPLVVVCGFWRGGGFHHHQYLRKLGARKLIFSMLCIYPKSINRKRNFENRFLPSFHEKIVFTILKSFLDMKIGENVYFYMRIKKAKVNCWPKIAFYPLKKHYFILGFLRSSCKKGHRKA